MDPIQVTVSRGDLVESVHLVDAVVVDREGAILASAGDARRVTYWRSSAKPFQALPTVRKAAQASRPLQDAEISVMCGSHAGEPAHVEQVAALLARFGLDESHLRCGAHPPLHDPSAKALWQAGEEPRRIHCNCSGKHAGMLVHAQLIGADLATYLEQHHPVQQAILETVSLFSGVPQQEIVLSIDGCGAPVFGLPLHAMGRAYANLVAPGDEVDAATQQGAATVVSSMQQKPFFVAGTGRICTRLMEVLAPRVVAKGGAEGVYCAGLPEKGWGIALKVHDGAGRATGPAIIEILAALGLIGEEAAQNLEEHRRPVVTNHAGVTVGQIEARLAPGFEARLRHLAQSS